MPLFLWYIMNTRGGKMRKIRRPQPSMVNGKTLREFFMIEYVENGRSALSIAEELGFERRTIDKWLTEYGVPKISHHIPKEIQGVELKEYLRIEYLVNKRTSVDIANELGFHRNSITRWMEKFGIPIRTISEDNHRRYSIMSEQEIKNQTRAANEKTRSDPSFMSCRKGHHPWEDFSDEKIIAIKEKISKSKSGDFNPTRTHYGSFIKGLRLSLIRKPLPVEVLTCKALSDADINFEYQVIVGRYIVDILIPDKDLVFEIEQMSKWDLKRRAKKYLRKDEVEKHGYKVVFVERSKLLKDPNYILNFI